MTGFTLLTLRLKRVASDAVYETVARVVGQRIRATDTCGWLNEGRIGIILPETSAAGAWKVANDLGPALEQEQLTAQFELYVYPSVDENDQSALEEAAGSAMVMSNSSIPVQALQVLLMQKLPLWKRVIDITAASVGLIIAFPAMLAAALAIKVTSRGPIFYSQRRDGWGGRKFLIHKFRTMVVNADAIKAQLRSLSEQDGPAFKLKNDPRVTPIGRWLRRTCVDELPQLWNVLRGDMSLVGPRPMCTNEAKHCNQWERRRLDVTPGLTCIWQVHGGTKVTFSEWMRMDLRYVRSRSFLSDVNLLIQTVPSVIRRDGVY